MVSARLILLFQKAPALNRLDAYNVEKICGDQVALHPFRHVAAGKIDAPPSLERELFERMPWRSPIEVVGHRDLVVWDVTARVFVPDGNDAIEIGEWQRSNNECVDAAEDGAVRADAQRQSYDSDRRKRRALYEVSDRKANVT